jgi:hypothetical protein
MTDLPIEQDPDVNGLLGAAVSFFVKGNLQKTAQGFVSQNMLSQSEANQLVSGGMVVVKLLAKLQSAAKPPA